MTDRNDHLREAAKAGNLAEIKRLVAEGAEINPHGTHPPLLWAAESGSLESVQWLLDAGAEVDGNDGRSYITPLMCAAWGGHLDVVRLLVDHDAKIKRVDSEGETALQKAQKQNKAKVVEFLLNPVRRPEQPPSPDEISFSYPLDNRVLQEIFSFPRKERVTLVRRTEGGTVEAVTREAFADLSDRGILKKAFDEHRRRGGQEQESDIFPEALNKPGRLKL